MEARKFTVEEMISYVIEPDSFFTTEGDILLRTEFRRDYSVYFGILERIASGKTKRQELVSAFPTDISGQLFKLEDYFHLIKRENPVGRQKNARNFRFVMADDYLHFWFRFIYPNLGLIQQGSTARLERKILDELPDYTGRMCSSAGSVRSFGKAATLRKSVPGGMPLGKERMKSTLWRSTPLTKRFFLERSSAANRISTWIS